MNRETGSRREVTRARIAIAMIGLGGVLVGTAVHDAMQDGLISALAAGISALLIVAVLQALGLSIKG